MNDEECERSGTFAAVVVMTTQLPIVLCFQFVFDYSVHVVVQATLMSLAYEIHALSDPNTCERGHFCCFCLVLLFLISLCLDLTANRINWFLLLSQLV